MGWSLFEVLWSQARDAIRQDGSHFNGCPFAAERCMLQPLGLIQINFIHSIPACKMQPANMRVTALAVELMVETYRIALLVSFVMMPV